MSRRMRPFSERVANSHRVTSEMANLAIEFAEQSRVVRHEEYKTTLIRQGVPQVLQNGSILLNVLQDVQTYNRIRLVLA